PNHSGTCMAWAHRRRRHRLRPNGGVGPWGRGDLGLTTGVAGPALCVELQDEVVQIARLCGELIQPLPGGLPTLEGLVAHGGLAPDQSVEALLVLVQAAPLELRCQLLALDLLAQAVEVAELEAERARLRLQPGHGVAEQDARAHGVFRSKRTESEHFR